MNYNLIFSCFMGFYGIIVAAVHVIVYEFYLMNNQNEDPASFTIWFLFEQRTFAE